jgi:hypothetical protein
MGITSAFTSKNTWTKEKKRRPKEPAPSHRMATGDKERSESEFKTVVKRFLQIISN